MNHIYRLCWNRTLRAWVPASELAKSKSVGTSRSRPATRVPLMLSLLSVSLGMSGLAWAGNTPMGGQVVSGSGQITQSGSVTTIQQNSQTLSLNWQSFGIGADQTVNFLQPGSSAIAVNRVLGNTASEIYGHLNANGQVWLINPNGVLFGKDAQVNVGGIVASTLDLDASTLGTGNVRFAGNGKGSVVNLGAITVTPGGYVALLGNTVSNQGVIRAQLGTVALAGGTAMTLTFADNHLMHLVVEANTVKSLVENRQLIVADGGNVLMTAGARNSLIDSAVNNTGTVQAQTVAEHNGTITLLGGMEAGTVNAGGTLDASAPNGGNGGFIETSGAQAHIADGAVITTKAAGGKDGTWLVDPTDFTIAASGGDITASTLESQLVSGNVAFTSANGAGGTSGNINVNQAVTWSANTSLTLTASNNVNLNAAITNTGAGGKTVLNAGNAFINNAGASGLGGHWAIYSASPTATGEKLGGLTPNFIQYNAPIGTAAATGATGNGVFYSYKPTLTISGLTGTVKKSYDGTTSATLAGGNFTDSGLVNGDVISSAAGTYSQSDVGTSLTVTSPSSISGFSIVNGSTPVYGYTLSGASRTANIGEIDAAQLYASIIGDPTKVYDGTTTATLTPANYFITGLAAGQSITVNQPSSVGYASADVNTNGGTTPGGGQVAVNASFISTNFVVGSGTKLSNYILPTASSITSAALAQDATAGYGIITPAPVQLSGVLATNKTYDRTTSDTLDTSNANIYGVLGTDHVTLDKSNAVGIFASANAGNNIAVALGGFTLVDTTDSAGVAATKVADYQLIAPTSLTADIARYALTVSGITANNKTYDGTTADTLNTSGAQLSPALSGDSVQLTGTAAGTFSQSDAGTGLAVAVNGLSVDNSNYVVNAPTGLTANITPRVLDIQFSGSADKIYDGTDYATLSTSNFTIGNVVSGQTVSVKQTPAVYSGSNAPNVGTDTVTATLQSSDLSFANGAKAGNYSFNTSVVGSGNITPAPLTVAINGNPTRTYDGTGDTSATLSGGNFTLSGVIPGESITLNGPTAGNYYDTSNGAAPNPASYEGNAGVWGVVAALSGSNFSANGSTLLSNYALPTLALGYGTITKANAGVYLVTDVTGSKVYDGTNALTIAPGSATNYLVLGGLQGGDQATLTSSVAGAFADKNVGSQPLTVTNLVASDFTFTSGSASNYTFAETVTGTGTITPAALAVSIVGNPTKTYDGNTTVLPLASGNFQIAGFVSGEGATINPTASFTYATANAGASGSNAISGTLTQNNYVANSGTLLSNYTLDYTPAGFGTINKADLYVTGVYASNKVYDTTDDATVNIVNGQLAGLANVDKNQTAITLTVGNTTTSSGAGATQGSIAGNGAVTGSTVAGTFASSDAGNGQAVSTIFSLGGTSANNYNLVAPTLTANITPAPLTIGGIVANNKVYDGTTNATFGASNSFTFDTQNATLSGFVGADNTNDVTLSATGTTGTFSTANVGNNLSVTGINGFSLGAGTAGDKSNDYYVVQPTGLTAGITPRPLSVTITGNPTKVYDGTTSATLTAGDYTIGAVAGNPDSGWVSGQGATLPQSATASYASPDVNGVNGSVVNSTLVSSDWKIQNSSTLLSNYILPTSATGLGTITPLVLNLSATRVYDTTTNIYASLSGNVTNADNANVFGTLTGLNGDQFSVTGTGATTSKNVGTYTSGAGSFNLGSLGLANAGSNSATEKASNYTLVGGVDSYTITKAPLDITGASVTAKVYDGTTTATVTGATLTSGNVSGDVLPGDNVAVSNGNIAGTFNSKNAGTGKTVTINGGDITGADTGNYSIVQPAGLTGTINQRPVTISGVRSYNGLSTVVGNSGAIAWATPAAVAGDASSGIVSGDSVAVNGGTGSVSLADVGTYNSDGSGSGTFTATGLALSNANYAIASTGNQFQITPYVVNFTGSSTYTGNATVSVGAGNFLNGSNAVSATDGSFATGVNGETLILDGPYTLANSGNAGTHTTSANGLSLGNGTGNASNYQFGNVNYTINPYVLSFSGSRNYDGTKNVYGGGLGTLSGLNGDAFTVSGTGSLGSANKGSYGGSASGINGTPSGTTQIGVSGLALNATGANSGTELASNYTFVGGNDTYDINAKLVTITGQRVYDGLVDANGGQAGTSWVVNGVTSGDLSNVSVAGNGSVSSANIGSYGDSGTTGANVFTSNVGSGGLSLGGSEAGNYTLATTGNTFTITPYVVNLSGDRAYNGSTSVDVGIGNFTSNGSNSVATNGNFTGVNGETLTLAGPYSLAGLTNTNGTAGGNAGTNTTSYNAANASGLSLAGATAGNYIIGSVDYTVNKVVLNLSGTRVYDGTTDAQASAFGSNGVLSTGIGSETVNLSGTGQVGDKNIGTDKPFTGIGSLALSDGGNGGLAGNYTLAGSTDTLTITPKHIDATVTAANKVYDTTDTATVTQFGSTGAGGTGTGVLAGDTVGFTDTGATFSDANAANGKTVTVAGIATSGADAGNYVLDNSTATTTANITPYVLGLTGQRVYDATTDAYGNDFSTVSGLNGDTFTVSGTGSVSSKNIGSYNGVGGSSFGLGNLALVGGGTALSSNYTLVGGTDQYTITPAMLTVAGTVVGTKTYDGNTAASLSGSTLTGVLGSDTVTLGNDTTGTFASPNAGTNIGVTAGTMTIGGADAGNYIIVQPTGLTGSINPYVLGLTGQRVYDATTGAYGGDFSTVSGLNGDTFTVSGTGSVSSKNVGSYAGVGGSSFGLGNLALVSGGTALSSNYTLVGGTDQYTITPATLTVAGTVVGTKTYDGNTAASLSGSTLTGVLGSDTVTLGNDTTGTFASPNAGTNISVTAGTMTIGGTDAGNYTLAQPTGLTGTITPVVLDLTSTRVYDGNTDAVASLFGSNGVLTGVNGETLTLGGTGTLSSKNVGTQQPFASHGLSGFTLTGNGSALAGNYTLTGGTDWLTITPLTITVDANGKDKTYDGTTTATVTLGSSGVLAGDTVAFIDGSANFHSPNAGTGVPISVTGITASGTDAGNYSFNTTASTSATINPYALDLTGTRVYDTTSHAYGNDFGTIAGLGSDTFTVSGTGSVSSKNVGSYNGVGGSSFGLGSLALVSGGSALADNYTLVGGTDKYTITPATLTVAGTTVGTKTYDGNTTASLSGSTLTGVLGGDSVTLGNDTTGTFISPNAGTEGVTTGMTIGGGDAGNYLIVQPVGVTGTINPYVLDLISTRVYDGTTNAYANLFGNGGVLTGIDGQTLILSGMGQVGDKNVGADKPFARLGSLALSDGGNGGLAGNYTLVGGTDVLSITPKTIAVNATGTNKMYDSNTLDTVTLASGGVVTGDSLQFGYGAAHFADPNIGNGKVVTVTGVQLSGTDVGNYLLASPTVYIMADITGAQASAFGISNGTLASARSVVGPTQLATPYGVAPQDAVGAFSGNEKRLHRPVERNVSRDDDFASGLALKVIDGGLRVPVQAMP
jgi:trimeric autotransporter adhesin